MTKRLDPPRSDASPISKIEHALKEHVIGQDRAIQELCCALHRAFAGLNDPNRPIATLMFAGPTGVGKTWTAKVLGNLFKIRVVYRCQKYDECGFQISEEERDRDNLSHCLDHEAMEGTTVPLERIVLSSFLIINCGELGEGTEHAITKLLGAPPSYIGHNSTKPLLSGGEAPRVVLFDEFEKALFTSRSPEGQTGLASLLLSILDEGKIVNNLNEEVDFTGSIIILTSNIGNKKIIREVEGGVGFTAQQERKSIPQLNDEGIAQLNESIYQLVKNAVRKALPPELLNRIDRLVVFRYLTGDEYRQILDLELDALQTRIEERSIVGPFHLTYTTEVKDLLIDRSLKKREYGARPLKDLVRRKIASPLAEMINSGCIHMGDRIEARREGGKIVFYQLDTRTSEEGQQDYHKEERRGMENL